ncbi:hypothetical protein [Paraburkholderia tropica]|uniref:hypothetical protein n=1 Tax=Paraburkholderia tropica TaxID=92647 RepID=UPI0007EC722B|nr:hypothetical protein [Paraburkholderia tropica]OBR53736.1 hypothetical protein A6456_12445 [Paraburkholderia tropica]
MSDLVTARKALSIAQSIVSDIAAIQAPTNAVKAAKPTKRTKANGLTRHQRTWLAIPTDRQAAALKALADHEGGEKPAGSYDNANRWYPAREFDCCAMIRSPSRAWPFSKLKHCLSLGHKEALHNAEHADVLALRRVLDEHAQAIDAGLPLVTQESKAWLEALPLHQAADESAGTDLPSRKPVRL